MRIEGSSEAISLSLAMELAAFAKMFFVSMVRSMSSILSIRAEASRTGFPIA
jgi:hypothetical protein